MSDHTSTPSRPGSPLAALPELASSRPFRFNWDSGRKGPASVSGTSEGRGDYIGSNGNANLYSLNFSTSALGLGALPEEWSSTTQGFNAISTVLNNPRKKGAPPKAHASVPPVPPSDLPRVRRKDFESYLTAITPEWERFEKNTEAGRGVTEDGISFESPNSRWDIPFSPTTPKTPRLPPGKSLPPLDTVPQVFFVPDFNLGDPRTFALVTEQQGEGEDATDPSTLAHSLPLLEKLSHHADTIELHLIREISRRSSSFFAALTNLHDLQTESEQCLDRIQRLRAMLKEVDEKSAKKGLDVVRKEAKLRNLGAVRQGLKTVHGVGEMLHVAKGLVTAGEWGEALSVVEGIQGHWDLTPLPQAATTKATLKKLQSNSSLNGKHSPLPPLSESLAEGDSQKSSKQTHVPLSSLRAFASLPENLRMLTLEISTSLSSELIHVLQSDLQLRMEGSDGIELVNQAFKDRLRPLVQGLKRTKGVREFFAKWRETVEEEVRGSVKRHLPLSGDLDDDPGSTSAAERGVALKQILGSMAQSEFIGLARNMYTTLLNGIQGVQTQSVIFLDVLGAIQSPDSSSAEDAQSLQGDIADVISTATEAAHDRASKVISIRSEQHASLELPDFMAIFSETWEFVIKTEVICRRMIVGLRGSVVSQAKAFLQKSHNARISQSARFVEDEQWVPAEVSMASQSITDVLVDAAVRDPPQLVLTSSTSTSPLPGTPLVNGTSSPSEPSLPSNGTKPSKHLRVEDRPYFAVSATLQTLVLLADYLKIIINLPLLTTDAVGRVIEFLKAFNSRTCQVVLGAGAMRSAGLRNITAKHLALASQSLSIIIALIPYVRESFRRHLNPMQAVMLVEFDKLKRDYQEHQNEIHAKLIAIMGDRLSAHCKSLQVVDWNSSRDGVNEYMELLVKETVTLHKVLSRYLPEQVVEYVMSQVFASINHRLSEEYGSIELPNQAAKDLLLRDARYLHQKLSALKNVGTPTTMLETVVMEKHTPRRASSTLGDSTNERLRGMFARSSTLGPSEPASPSPHSSRGDKKDRLPSLPATPPPPMPGKGGEPVSILRGARSESPVAVIRPPPPEKDLPHPGAIVDAGATVMPARVPTVLPPDGDRSIGGGSPTGLANEESSQ